MYVCVNVCEGEDLLHLLGSMDNVKDLTFHHISQNLDLNFPDQSLDKYT